MEITSKIDKSLILINIEPQYHYGIMLSGGLDSATMLELILQDAKAKNITVKIQPFCIRKHDGSTKYVRPILDFFEKRYDIKLPDPIFAGDPDCPHRLSSTIALKEIATKHPEIDFMFSGENQNPPDLDYSVWGEGHYPNRVKEAPSKRILMPFVHLYKHHVLDLMFEYDLQEIFNISHSCTDQADGRCNKCFQCTERAWAFTKLGKIDTGTN